MATIIQDLITIARNESGLKEDPKGSNKGPCIEKYAGGITGYKPGNAWCVAFVHWCFYEIQVKNIPDTLSVEAFYNYYKAYDSQRILIPEYAQPGDIAVRLNYPGMGNHMGIVTAKDVNGGVWYISGNTTNPKYKEPEINGEPNDFFVCEKLLKYFNAVIRLLE